MASAQTDRRPDRSSGCAPILVLGLGNILLRDEGVGVRVIEAMQRMDMPPGVELFDGATAGLDLLDVLADRRKVIVIDAMDADAAPGTVARLRPDDLAPQGSAGLSLHEIGVLETLEAAKRLGICPKEVVIFGVKPKDLSCGLELSPEIAELVPRIVDMVLAELRSGYRP